MLGDAPLSGAVFPAAREVMGLWEEERVRLLAAWVGEDEDFMVGHAREGGYLPKCMIRRPSGRWMEELYISIGERPPGSAPASSS